MLPHIQLESTTQAAVHPRRNKLRNGTITQLKCGLLLKPPLTLEQQPAQTVTCHNDLNPWNILVTADGWVTLDWEFVGQNDVLFDLVSLHQGLALNVESLPDLASNWAQDLGTDYSSEGLSRAFGQFWLRE